MSDPLFNALEPVRLVMRRMECMYCRAPDTTTVLVDDLFGLKVCNTHKSYAVRDCKAYLHTIKKVRVRDAMAVPVLNTLLSTLEAMETFSVERTNGLIDPGWSLRKGSGWDPAFLVYANDGWCVPVMKDDTRKNAKIIQFINTAFHTCIEDSIDCLNEGVYRAEYEEFQHILEQDRVGTVGELEGVQTILYEGVPARILVQGLVQPADPTDPEEATDPSRL